MDFAAADKLMATLDQCRANPRKVSHTEPLYVGVDLGTAYIVVVVVNARREPVACA